MSVVHTAAIRNGLANLVGDAHDVGGGASVVEIRESTTILVSFPLPNPAFDTAPASGAGIIEVQGVPNQVNAIADGVADNFVTRDRAGTQILSGSVTLSGFGGDIEVTNTNILTGQACSLDDLSYEAAA